MILYVAIMLIGVFIAAAAQVLLKKSSQIKYSSKIREYLNVRVILAYTIMVISSLMSVFAYKKVPLSMGTILGSTSYLYVAAFGVMVFHEKLNFKKILGLVLIVAGVIVYSI